MQNSDTTFKASSGWFKRLNRFATGDEKLSANSVSNLTLYNCNDAGFN